MPKINLELHQQQILMQQQMAWQIMQLNMEAQDQRQAILNSPIDWQNSVEVRFQALHLVSELVSQFEDILRRLDALEDGQKKIENELRLMWTEINAIKETLIQTKKTVAKLLQRVSGIENTLQEVLKDIRSIKAHLHVKRSHKSKWDYILRRQKSKKLTKQESIQRFHNKYSLNRRFAMEEGKDLHDSSDDESNTEEQQEVLEEQSGVRVQSSLILFN